MKGLLVGTGYMGVEYCKVLQGLSAEFDVIGRSRNNVQKFQEITQKEAREGGLEKWKGNLQKEYDFAIVAVEVDALYYVADLLLDLGIKKILIEKPGCRNLNELEQLKENAKKRNIDIYIAYNRRFFESVVKAEEMIKEDGGVLSVNFEFTEWIDRLLVPKPIHSLEDVMYRNSTHVIDLAFYFAGIPKDFRFYHAGWIDQMKNPSIYAGAGITDKNVLFCYQANWDAPGRWSVEVLTKVRRYYFKPMEELWTQNRNSTVLEQVTLPNEYDVQYKPGLYKMVETFLNHDSDSKLLTLDEQINMTKIYNEMK